MEDVAEISGVIAGIELDEARCLNKFKDIGIDLGGIEVPPGNIVWCPVRHHNLPCRLKADLGKERLYTSPELTRS
jgi:hypothetical protein